MNFKIKFSLVKQQDESDCGAACIATVAKYYGKRIPISKIRNLAGTDTKGTSAKGIEKAANAIDFSCKIIISKSKKLGRDLPFPLIAHIIRDNLEHYVVVYKIKKNKLLIADPAKNVSWTFFEDFYKLWSGIFFLISPTENFEETNETKNFFQRFFYLLSQNKGLAVQVFIASLILTILGILGAFYFRYLIDDVIYSYLTKALVSISLGYLAVIIFQNILLFCRNHLLNFFSIKIEASLILEYFTHILHLPLDFFVKRKSGEILSRLTDIETIKNALSSMSVGVILDCTMLFFGGIVLFMFSPKLVSVAIIPVIISGILVLLFSKHFKNLILQKSISEAEKYSFLLETINGISTVKALSSEDESRNKAELKILTSLKKGFSLKNLENIQLSLQNFLSQAGNLAVYWYGSYLIMRGELSLGELIAFVTLLGFFLSPLSRLITLQPLLQELSVASKRLGEILDLQKEDKNNGFLEPNIVKGNISIRNISFSYGSRGNTLKNISMEIKAGDKIAIVGPSGSGKTTLAKLLLKFYLPDEGDILIDGFNIKDISTSNYRNYFGYVPQEILLFSGTIEENIAWGNSEISAEDIFNAARDAEALDFISKLDDRFATKVGERGATLSGGERQRIALARVLLRNPKILLLDEATSNLDSLSETKIMQTIFKIKKDFTTIIIAHRLSTIKMCDKIFVISYGQIVESGNHQNLLRKNGIYANMWKTQNDR